MKLPHLILLFALVSRTVFAQNGDISERKWSYYIRISQSARDIPFVEEDIASAWDNGYLYSGGSFNSKTRDRSLNLGLKLIHYRNDNSFIRLSSSLNRVDVRLLPKVFSDDPSGMLESFDKSYKTRTDFEVFFEDGWMHSFEKLNLYCGMGIGLIYYSKANVETYTEVDSSSNGKPINSYERIGKLYDAMSFGVSNFLGVTYQLNKFSLGGEVSYALLYSRTLGGSNIQLINRDLINNTTISDVTLKYNPIINSINISKITPSILISYNF